MEELWDSSRKYIYHYETRESKYIHHIDEFEVVPINNGMLAKAKIPFGYVKETEESAL